VSRPAPPNPERLREEAEDLLSAHAGGSTQARTRVRAVLPEAEDLRPDQAQLVVAREYGFTSWSRLREHVDRVAVAGGEPQHVFEDQPSYYADRAEGLLASALDNTPGPVAAFARWSAPLTSVGARSVVAGDHGFRTWAELTEHVTAGADEPFALAFRALRAHDLDTLVALLDRYPWLVTAAGTNGNDLLGLAAASGDEPTVTALVERGADVSRGNVHGWTALHAAGYSDRPELARMLLAAGAGTNVAARGDGGTPLVVALFWGNRRAAEVLAAHDLAPRNLRVAAGLDDVALLEELWDTPAAGAHRGFYRPHGGFPPWRPSDSPTEVRDEALGWAARSGSLRAISTLAARGADLDANVYQGSALCWAATKGRVDAVRLLLELGADPDRRGTFGGPGHGVATTALHHAAENGHLAVVEALLAAGADPAVTDALYDGTPAGWAEHFGHREVAEVLRSTG
jgi:ankyrin repeat protein